MSGAVEKPGCISLQPSGASYKWSIVFMLWFICFFNYADRQAIFSVFPKLKEEFGFDPVQRGLIGAAFMWVYAFGAPFAGFIADRVSRKRLILGGCLFWSGITVMTAWCGKLWQFVAVRALEGLGETFYFPASMSMISEYHDRRTRSRALSFHQSSVYLGTIGGSWLGAWFAQNHGWRSAFYLFGAGGALVACALVRFLREPPRITETACQDLVQKAQKPTQATLVQSWRAVFRTPAAVLLMGAFLGANFVAAIFLTWAPTFLVEKFHLQLTSAGLSGALFIHLASAVSVPIAGLLADKLSARFTGGRMLIQAAGLITGSVFVFVVGTTQEMGTLIVAMTLFGFFKGFYDSNIFASLYDVVEPRVRATAAGIMNTVGWGGGAIGPIAVGWVSKHGRLNSEVENMSEAIALGSLVYLVAAALLCAAIFFSSKSRTGET